MLSSTPSEKGQILKGNCRLVPLQMVGREFGNYHVCQDINNLKKYTCKIVQKYALQDDYNVWKRQSMNTVLDIKAKAAYYQFNISKSLKHRNILNLVNKIEDQKKVFLFYDYCNQGTLRDLLNSDVKFSPKQLVIAFQQLTQGMLYLHRQNLQHLEITPSNIMVESYGKTQFNVYKLAQFSKLRFITNEYYEYDDTNSSDSDQYTPIPSDINYQAPEMIKDQNFQSFKSDVWSLGIIFYQMTFGKLPWKRRTGDSGMSDKSKQAFSQTVTFPAQSKVSPSIVYLLQDMLQKSYQKRISMVQVQSQLRKLAFFF